MKWARRILHLVALMLLSIIAFSLIGLYLYRGTPHWYRPALASAQQIKDAANSADQKLLDLFSWAAGAQAERIRKLRGISGPDDSEGGPKTITLTDDEVTSFFYSWSGPDKVDLEQRISRYFTDGRVIFTNDGIILAGNSPALGTLVSMEFNAGIDNQGQLNLSLASMRAGLLPIPQSVAAPYFQRLQAVLEDKLAEEQPYVQIDRTMTANAQALAASWLKLLLSSLAARPSDPTLIIPFDLAHLSRGLPVKLTNIKVEDGQITLTVQPLTPDDRQSLFEQLQQRVPGAS